MRFQVPQFVDIEDKIVGPLTLKQFMVYMTAVLLLVPVFLRSDVALFLTIAIPTMGVAALFAHFRFHGKSLFALAWNILRFYGHGSLYIWRRVPGTTPLKLGEDVRQMWEEQAILAETEEGIAPRLQVIAKTIETEGHVSQVDEADPLDATGTVSLPLQDRSQRQGPPVKTP